jgi:type I restriction enzyme M protein
MAAIKKTKIYSSLWASCDELRGGMDASQYKDYILTLLFVKYVSDKAKTDEGGDIIVPNGGSFDDIVALKGTDNIGEGIDKIIAKLAEANTTLKGVIGKDAHFNDSAKLGSGKEMVDKLTKIIAIFQRPELNFENNRVDGDDILGDAYEYLMRLFATESGKSKGQFYTPAEVSRILAKVIGVGNATKLQTAYDPACGSGSLLIKVTDEVPCEIAIYGQEKEITTAGLAIMNLVLHNRAYGEIRDGNTFASPQYLTDDKTAIRQFDFIVANPPFSLKNWSTGLAGKEFGRFEGYGAMPPEKNGDYAWLLHILKSLKRNGKAAVILPHGVLFRGNSEGIIRKNIIERRLIKGIIGLPSNLFYGTGIPACIIIIDKENTAARTGVFMIDASRDFVKDGNKNRLRERDIYKIVTTFNGRIEEAGYSRLVPYDEIETKNDCNLNIPRYIDGGTKEDLQDINGHLNGGIPSADVDGLSKYWNEFKGLKEKLFAFLRDGYYKLVVPKDEIRDTIWSDMAFETYGKKIDAAFIKWQKTADMLHALTETGGIKEIITLLAEKILADFAPIKLIDKYDVYEALLSYWQSVMADDVYLVMKDGYEVGRETEDLKEVISSGKNKGNEKIVGWDGKVIPKDLIIKRFYGKEKLAVDEAERFIDEAQGRLDELAEEHGGDEGILHVEDDDGSLLDYVKKEIKKAKADKGTDNEDYLVLTEYLRLATELSEKKKVVKAIATGLDAKARAKYETLTIDEIKELLVNQKWYGAIFGGILALYNAVSQNITARIVEVAERYENTLPQLESDTVKYETNVKEHLKRIGFVW